MISWLSMFRPAIVLLLLAWTFPATAQDNWRFPTDRITPQQWQTYLNETLAKPNVRAHEEAGQIIVEVPQETAIYVFTTTVHPAHPAVVIRRVVEINNQIFLDRKGHYAGEQAAYEAWWRQFDALDNQTRQHIQD